MNKKERWRLIKELAEEIEEEDLIQLSSLVQKVRKKVPLKIKEDLAEKLQSDESMFELADQLDENFSEDFHKIRKSISNGSFNWDND